MGLLGELSSTSRVFGVIAACNCSADSTQPDSSVVGTITGASDPATGDLLLASEAERIGLINHSVPLEELDERVYGFCDRLNASNVQAISWTKVTANLELKRVAHALMDPGIAYEALSVRSEEHKRAVAAMRLDLQRKSSRPDLG